MFTAADVSARPYGRAVVDSPLLAADKVRFVGERVAAVVAETRAMAEAAAALVEIEYEPLPAVLTAADALAPDAPAVHERPWAYEGAVAQEGDGANVIHRGRHGSLDELEAALSRAAHTVDETYRAHSVHQGYLEPQACIAHYESPESVRLWLTNKAPYRLRSMVGQCVGVAPKAIDVRTMPVGGDFGGKGSAQNAPICVELSRLTRRPIKSVLSYTEDLTTTNPRHPADVRVRIGCDDEGRILGASIQAILNAGAYAGFTAGAVGPHGVHEVSSYRIPVFVTELTRVYTNTVPRGHMRAPGSPQGIFAFESAMDELAATAGLEPAELRRRNLLHTGETATPWAEHRGVDVLEAALGAVRRVEPPTGWLHGQGIAAYSRKTTTQVKTSLRLTSTADGGVCVETPLVETGTGSHTVLRQLVADQLGFAPADVEVRAVSTSDLPFDNGAGASRVTAGFATAVDAAAKAWHNRSGRESILVEVDEEIEPAVGSYIVQLAQVAVDPDTGQLRVLELLTAVDVAQIVNPAAYQMQIDGGVAMGFGYACLEDLLESEGQVWAKSLSEFKMPSARDMPILTTVMVPGAIGVGTANVKSIGESTTPPVPAAIANAVFAATGARIRELPLTSERIHRALRGMP